MATTSLRLIITAIVGDMTPDTIELKTEVDTVEQGMKWISEQLTEMAETAVQVV